MALVIHHSPSPPPHHSAPYGNNHYAQPHADEIYGTAPAPKARDTVEVARLCDFLKSCFYSPDNREIAESCEKKGHDKKELHLVWRLQLTPSDVMGIPEEIKLLTRSLTIKLIYDRDQDMTAQLPAILDKLHQTGCRIGCLDLSACSLTSLPPQIGKLTSVKTLELVANSLEDLPPELAQLTDLQSLNLSGNALKTVPKVVHQFRALTELSLHDNPISELPLSLRPIILMRPAHAKWINA